MKLLKTLLFVLLPVAVLAQGFPVNPVFPAESEATRISAEGMPIEAVYRSANSTWTTSTSFYSGKPTPSTAWLVENISISSDTALSASLQFSYVNVMPSGKVSPLWTVGFPKTGGAQNFAFNKFIYEGTAINATAQAAGGKSTSWVRGGVVATKVSSDFNRKADRVLMKIGDSISDGINTDANGEDTWDFKTRDTLEVLTGKRWRIVNKALSGATSSNLEAARVSGQLSPRQVDMIVYQLGMNDADATAYPTNLANLIKWKKRTYPLAVLLVVGPTPGKDAPKEAILAAIRTNAQSQTSGQEANRIFYVNLGTAWDYTTQQATYTNATDLTHPTILGHAKMYNLIRGALSTTLVNYLK